MIVAFIHRHVSPPEAVGELLFGLIMALTLTLGAGLVGEAEKLTPLELSLALIGCNVAWGIIDAVLYLLGSVFNRNLRIQFVRRLKAAPTRQEALRAIREEFELDDEPVPPGANRTAFDEAVLGLIKPANTDRARLRSSDFASAAVVVLLVSVTALPGVLPLLLVHDPQLGLRLANLVQVCLLFLVGHRWARLSGASPVRTGLVIVVLGVALVLVAVLLGG